MSQKKDLDDALVRLTKLREEMVRVPSPRHAASCIAIAARFFNGRNSVESTSRQVGGGKKEELRKMRARSLSVPVPDCQGRPRASSRDKSKLMAILIERHSRRKFESVQPFGGKQLVPSRDPLV